MPAVVLLTGATGFIGRHTVWALAGRGAKVHAMSRAGRPVPGAVSAWAADLFDPARVIEVVQAVRPTHLLHLAWDVTPGRFWTAPANLDWVAGSLHLARTFVEAGGKRLVAAGTCAEYDWTGSSDLNEHQTPLRPITLYGVAKDALRRVLERYCDDARVSWAWGRIFNPYGPGEPAEKLVASVVTAVLEGQPAACSAGNQERDYIHVADVAEAFATLTLCDVAGCVNIGSGTSTTVGQVATLIGELAGRPDLIRLGERPVGTMDAPRAVADITRLQDEVGWRPARSLEIGLAETLRSTEQASRQPHVV